MDRESIEVFFVFNLFLYVKILESLKMVIVEI